MKLINVNFISPLLFFSLFLVTTSSLQQNLPECLLDQGCMMNITNIEGIVQISPQISKKTSWILLFADKIVFAFENNQIKTFSFGEINLDCGYESNKLCVSDEFRAKFPEKHLPKSNDSSKLCFVLPSIFSEKPALLCKTKLNDDFDFLVKINTIAKLTDNYHIKMLQDRENPLNNFARNEADFFFLDQKRIILTKVKLLTHKIEGFLGNKLKFEWDLKDLHPIKETTFVLDALKRRQITNLQLINLKKALNNSKTMEIKDCLVVFLNNSVNFLCSSSQSHLASLINGVLGLSNMRKYLKDFDLLQTIAKTHNNSIIFNPYMKELAHMRLRLIRLQQYGTTFCIKYKKDINYKACQQAKLHDYVDEMYFLARNSQEILSGLQKISHYPKILEVKASKYQQKTLSFLQIDPEKTEKSDDTPSEANLKKSQVFKKKVMEKLQENRRWFTSLDERSKGEFRKRSDSDPFVTYLGFVRDSMTGATKAQEKKLLNSQ